MLEETSHLADLKMRGKMLFVTNESVYKNKATGKVVAKQTLTSIHMSSPLARGGATPLTKGNRHMADQNYFEDVKEGQELAPLKITPDKQQLVKFAAGSGDFNPLHFDENFPMLKAMGLAENIVHGRFKYAQVGRSSSRSPATRAA